MLCIACVSAVCAQGISGRLTDEHQKPVGFANVVLLSLPDSAFIAGTISDESGTFRFEQTDNREKLLQISYMSYKPLWLKVKEQSNMQQSRTVTSLSNAVYDLYAGKLVLSHPIGNGSINMDGELIRTERNSDYRTIEDIVPALSTN